MVAELVAVEAGVVVVDQLLSRLRVRRMRQGLLRIIRVRARPSASVSAVGAGRGAGMARRGAGPGGGAVPAQDRDDRMVGILTQLLGRFPAAAPVQAPVVPPSGGGAAEGCGASRGLHVRLTLR